MKIVSTNIGEPKEMVINHRKKKTGIFKKSVQGIFLGTSDVEGDHVMNRKYHGGPEKACFVFSADHYGYWKTMYPDLPWAWGMFGENLTIEGWDESKVRIGDVYQVGEAQVQTSSPRIPCVYLAKKFEDKHMLKAYLHYKSPGTYFRVLKEGHVAIGDTLDLVHRDEDSMTILAIYELLSPAKKNKELYEKAMKERWLSPEFKDSLRKKY